MRALLAGDDNQCKNKPAREAFRWRASRAGVIDRYGRQAEVLFGVATDKHLRIASSLSQSPVLVPCLARGALKLQRAGPRPAETRPSSLRGRAQTCTLALYVPAHALRRRHRTAEIEATREIRHTVLSTSATRNRDCNRKFKGCRGNYFRQKVSVRMFYTEHTFKGKNCHGPRLPPSPKLRRAR